MSEANNKTVEYPYIPDGRTIEYVPADNEFMQRAKEVARTESKDKAMPNASVIVKNGEIIGEGANGSDWHEDNGCERVKLNMPSGQGYELCEGCHPKNHSEPTAIADAVEQNNDTEGADLYLWGHWWCCEPCWGSIKAAGVSQIYLIEDSEVLFDKNHPDNIIGRQFEV